MITKFKILFLFLCMPLFCDAQIGYQVALLSSATGEPRANETVRAMVEITDSQNEPVFSNTQTVTSNDFGILSLTVGNSDTFKDVALGRLPLFVSVSVDGILIGKSQILSVPVAEVATTLKSDLTIEQWCRSWVVDQDKYGSTTLILSQEGSCSLIYTGEKGPDNRYGNYVIEGNTVYVFISGEGVVIFRYFNGTLYPVRDLF